MRIALILHLIECFYAQRSIDNPLQKSTLERALAIAQYYRRSFEFLQEKVANNDEITSVLLKIVDRASKSVSGVSLREVYKGDFKRSIESLAKEAGVELAVFTEQLFSQLQTEGYGTVMRRGRSVKFVANPKKEDYKGENNGDNGDNKPEKPYCQDNLLSPTLGTIAHCPGDNNNSHLGKPTTESPGLLSEDKLLDEPESLVLQINSTDSDIYADTNDNNSLNEPVWLLQIELDGGDVGKLVGCKIEARDLLGNVKFTGEMTNWDEKHGNVTVATAGGERVTHVREAFLIG